MNDRWYLVTMQNTERDTGDGYYLAEGETGVRVRFNIPDGALAVITDAVPHGSWHWNLPGYLGDGFYEVKTLPDKRVLIAHEDDLILAEQPLVPQIAPVGKLRLVVDNYGKWSETHSEILVGDFDTIEQAREAALFWKNKPSIEHWTICIFDDAGRLRL